MKIQIASDLHLECEYPSRIDSAEYIVPPSEKGDDERDGPILILPGDIGCIYYHTQLYTFLKEVSSRYRAVIYVIGNQELYTKKGRKPLPVSALYDRLYALEDVIPNFYVLDRSCVYLEEMVNGNRRRICIAGCTLWSDLGEHAIASYLYRIHSLKEGVYRKMHALDVQFLEQIIEKTRKQNIELIVVTHHAPTYTILDKKWESNGNQYMYASHLDRLLQSEFVHTWICGHTHTNFDVITEGGTRLVSNQKGKAHDKITDYSKTKIIEV